MGVFGAGYGNMQPQQVAKTPDFIGANRTSAAVDMHNQQQKQQQQMEMLRGGAELGSKGWDAWSKTHGGSGSGMEDLMGKFGGGSASGGGAAGADMLTAASSLYSPAAAGVAGTSGAIPGAAFGMGTGGAGGAAASTATSSLAGAGAASNPVGWAALAALAAYSLYNRNA